MRFLNFAFVAVCALCVVSLANGQYGGSQKKDAYPPKDEYGKDKGKYEKKADDVLYVKGQPVEGGKVEEPIDDYGGKPGGEKVKEVKVEESYGEKPKGGYGDEGKYGKEVKDVKYDDKDKLGPLPEGDKYGADKGYGGDKALDKDYDGGKGGYEGGEYGGGKGVPPKGDEGGYGPVPVNPKESYGGFGPAKDAGYGKGGEFADDKFGGDKFGGGKFGGDKFGGDKLGGGKFNGIDDKGPKGGYGGDKFGEDKFGGDKLGGDKFGGDKFGGDKFGGDKFGQDKYGGVDDKAPKGGYGGEEKYDEPKKGGYGKAPKGGYGGPEPKGYGEEKYEEPKKGGYGKAPKGDFGVPEGPKGYGEEKFEGPKEEGFGKGGYGGAKEGGFGGQKGYGGEGKYEEVLKEGPGYGGMSKGPGYGGDKKGFEEKEINNGYGKFGGGEKPLEGGYGDNKYGGKKGFETEKKYGGGEFGGYGGPKPGESVTTMSTKACNKLVDGLLDKLQTTFTGHMKSYKVDQISPVKIGGWARVRLYDGKFDKIGKLCRGGDFQVLPQGENIIIRGTVTVPEPQAQFCGDAYLYNRLKVRNRNLRFCAKDALFRMQMIVNKRNQKIDVDDLEPVGIHGFHVEDEQGAKGEQLAWPFNKIREHQVDKQKFQFMKTLQNKLCGDFRQIVHKPEVKKEILELV